jgi:hypothetical protein
MPSTAVPTILKDPGYLFWAPVASALPAFTVVGSKFTDAWPVAWVSLGATTDGSKLKYSTKLESISVAEFFDPIIWITTERSGSFAMALASVTLANLNRAMNTGTLTTVSGSGTTLLSKLSPPAPGTEIRAMIGWESLDSTMRAVGYQTIQGGDILLEFNKPKADSNTSIPTEFNFEVPSSGVPVDFWAAGVARTGA